jgi:putative transposase
MGRDIQQELKRQTVKVRVCPNEDSLERLVSAVLVEIDDKWAADTKACIRWEYPDALSVSSQISRQQSTQSIPDLS